MFNLKHVTSTVAGRRPCARRSTNYVLAESFRGGEELELLSNVHIAATTTEEGPTRASAAGDGRKTAAGQEEVGQREGGASEGIDWRRR